MPVTVRKEAHVAIMHAPQKASVMTFAICGSSMAEALKTTFLCTQRDV